MPLLRGPVVAPFVAVEAHLRPHEADAAAVGCVEDAVVVADEISEALLEPRRHAVQVFVRVRDPCSG